MHLKRQEKPTLCDSMSFSALEEPFTLVKIGKRLGIGEERLGIEEEQRLNIRAVCYCRKLPDVRPEPGARKILLERKGKKNRNE